MEGQIGKSRSRVLLLLVLSGFPLGANRTVERMEEKERVNETAGRQRAASKRAGARK